MGPRRLVEAARPVRRVEAAAGRTVRPADGHVLLGLQRSAGNRAVTGLLVAQGSPRSDPAPRVPPGGPGRPAPSVQRTVTINGVQKTPGQVRRRPAVRDYLNRRSAANRARARVVIATWCQSPTVHAFARSAGLVKALRRALRMPLVGPAVGALPPAPYRAGDLVFVTQQAGRLPTLYFLSGGTSGRLRQQHPSGPLAQEPRQNKVDYFAPAPGAFAGQGLKHSVFLGTPAEQALSRVPVVGHFHLELTYAGNVVTVRHLSAGQVLSVGPNAAVYPQQTITDMYKAAIGQP